MDKMENASFWEATWNAWHSGMLENLLTNAVFLKDEPIDSFLESIDIAPINETLIAHGYQANEFLIDYAIGSKGNSASYVLTNKRLLVSSDENQVQSINSFVLAELKAISVKSKWNSVELTITRNDSSVETINAIAAPSDSTLQYVIEKESSGEVWEPTKILREQKVMDEKEIAVKRSESIVNTIFLLSAVIAFTVFHQIGYIKRPDIGNFPILEFNPRTIWLVLSAIGIVLAAFKRPILFLLWSILVSVTFFNLPVLEKCFDDESGAFRYILDIFSSTGKVWSMRMQASMFNWMLHFFISGTIIKLGAEMFDVWMRKKFLSKSK